MTDPQTASLVMEALTAEEEQTFSGAGLEYVVEVLSGSRQGQVLPVQGRQVVGSTPEADLVLNDPAVSRRHVLLEVSPKGLWVKDVGSKNGTFLNGTRVDGFVVRRETTFTVGATLLRVAATAADVAKRPATSFGGAVGQSPPMVELFALLKKVAPASSNVLLLGETGTGKDVLARALHQASPRRHRPFVALDCSALSPALAESELFGHVKGAFTGADKARAGAFAAADGGTIFLDEVGELPPSVQPKLLRVLEHRVLQRVGEELERPVDVRVVAATHRDLERRAESGAFRKDLYFRLAVVVARVPPLRERLEDLPLLAQALLARLNRPDVQLPTELLQRLQGHTWPGNVRELRNLLERVVCGAPVDVATGKSAELPAFKDAKEQMLESFTRDYFTHLFAQCDGNVAELARKSGLARTYVHEVVKKLGLKRKGDGAP